MKVHQSKIEELVQQILDEEEEAFDNMPESLQESERGETSQNAQDCLSDAIDALGEASDSVDTSEEIDDIIDPLEEAIDALEEVMN